MSAESQYNERLLALASMRHARNPALPGIARLGQLAGKDASQVVSDIMSNCGTPALESREVKRAVEFVFAQPVTVSKREEKAIKKHEDFVQKRVSGGVAGSAELMNISPQDVRMMTPREQALAYIATVFPDNRYYTFRVEDCYSVRNESTIVRPMDFYREIGTGRKIPNFVIANQFTGVPSDMENAIDGFPPDLSRCRKFANTKTLATFRLALVEFDDMPIKDQCAFWVDSIKHNFIKPVSIVYSGGKSLHALVRLPSREYVSRRLETEDGFESEEDFEKRRLACEECFREEQGKLEACLGASPSKALRMDRACKDPTRLTRMAGAFRADKNQVQRLLYCDWPSPMDVPKMFDGEVTYFDGYDMNGEYMDFK